MITIDVSVLQKLLSQLSDSAPAASGATPVERGAPQPVVVCTNKRGVFFGYTSDARADPIELTDARMCIYWPDGGVTGLADRGPHSEGFRIGGTAPSLRLPGVTAVMGVTSAAEHAWKSAPIHGRDDD